MMKYGKTIQGKKAPKLFIPEDLKLKTRNDEE